MRITYVGHATVLIEVAGTRLVTDPVLRGRIAHLRRHGGPPALEREGELDAVLISHLHADHLDRRSLDRLAPRAPIVAPSGARRVIERWARRDVRELAVGQSLDLAPPGAVEAVRIRATEADHDGRRYPFGPRAESVGYEISVAGRRIYFAGDTGLFPGMRELAEVGERGLDVALLPIWGWGTGLGPGHMDPEAAARAVALLKPRIVVPIHWGTLFPIGMASRAARRHLSEPPRRFAAQVAASSPDTEVRVLAPGESLSD